MTDIQTGLRDDTQLLFDSAHSSEVWTLLSSSTEPLNDPHIPQLAILALAIL